MYKSIFTICLLAISVTCFATSAKSDATTPIKVAGSNCDSTKIQLCMNTCLKGISPHSSNASMTGKMSKCVDSCSTQGCQTTGS